MRCTRQPTLRLYDKLQVIAYGNHSTLIWTFCIVKMLFILNCLSDKPSTGTSHHTNLCLMASGFRNLQFVLRTGEYFGVYNVDVYAAGEVIFLSTWGSVVGTVFGTLVAALIAMGLFFFVFELYRQNGWDNDDNDDYNNNISITIIIINKLKRPSNVTIIIWRSSLLHDSVCKNHRQ